MPSSSALKIKPHHVLENPVFLQKIFSRTNCKDFGKPAIFNSVCTAWSEAIHFYSAATIYWNGTLKQSPSNTYDKLHRLIFWCCFNNNDGWIFTSILEVVRDFDRERLATFLTENLTKSTHSLLPAAIRCSKNSEIVRLLLVEYRRVGDDFLKRHLVGEYSDNLLNVAVAHSNNGDIVGQLILECHRVGGEDLLIKHLAGEYSPTRETLLSVASKASKNNEILRRLLVACRGAGKDFRCRLICGEFSPYRTNLLTLACKNITDDDWKSQASCIEFLKAVIEQVNHVHDEKEKNNTQQEEERVQMLQAMLEVPDSQKFTPLAALYKKSARLDLTRVLDFLFKFINELGGKEYLKFHLELPPANGVWTPSTPFYTMCKIAQSVHVFEYFFTLFDRVGGKDYTIRQLESRCVGQHTPFQTFCTETDSWKSLDVIVQFFIHKFEEIGGGTDDYVKKQFNMRDNEGRSALLLALTNSVFNKDALTVIVEAVTKIGGMDLFAELLTLQFPNNSSKRDPAPIGCRAIQAVAKRRTVNIAVMEMLCDILLEQKWLLPALAVFSDDDKKLLSKTWKVNENYEIVRESKHRKR